ncbi:hypothetical protein [Roseixanthobacter liquoris]|uniref:hypothetical protein n=1 Tax=Roseixanthobacter liquoris TaxID=3119921 RepID=UPI0037273A1B
MDDGPRFENRRIDADPAAERGSDAAEYRLAPFQDGVDALRIIRVLMVLPA